MTSSQISTSQREGTTEEVNETVRKARQTAIEMMRKAGYDIGTRVKVVVDPQLPFMGYTMPQGGNFTIVVSGGAVWIRLPKGIVGSRKSHGYRIQGKYPPPKSQIP